jgi:DNA invertase Pin-like site-specific DNA recombinase
MHKGNTMTKAVIYARVSTKDQNTENQIKELREVATKSNWEIVKVYSDVKSGSKGRANREGLNAMLTAVTKREVDQVLCWSVDRLGRSLTDLVSTMDTINSVGANLYIHTQGLDTNTPTGRAMFEMVGVFAQFERSLIVERVNAGLAVAKAKGVKLGRPKITERLKQQIRGLIAEAKSVRAIAKEMKVSTGTVINVKKGMTSQLDPIVVPSKPTESTDNNALTMTNAEFREYAKSRLTKADNKSI